MENNEIMETIEETKETLVDTAENAGTSTGKVLAIVGLAGLTLAGLGYAGYKFIKKKRAKDPVYDEDSNVVDGKFTEEDADPEE